MKYDRDTVKDWAGDSQWRAWRADLARFKAQGASGWGSEGFWALSVYRAQRGAMKMRPTPITRVLGLALRVVKKFVSLVTLINIDRFAVIGPGTYIPHFGPIQINLESTLGADCAIHPVCTVGSAGSRHGGPMIGDHVMLGAHSCVLGPVHVGDGATVASGAVVVSDVPAGAVAVGVPARARGTTTPDDAATHSP